MASIVSIWATTKECFFLSPVLLAAGEKMNVSNYRPKNRLKRVQYNGHKAH